MNRLLTIVCIVAIGCRPSPPSPPVSAEPTPLLASGFEQGVVLQPPKNEAGDWVQYLSGSDLVNDWRNLPQRAYPRNRTTYLVPSSARLATYAESKIEVVPDRNDRATRALYMSLKRQAPAKEGTRVQYGIYPPATTTQGYVSYWMKLQPNLATEILPPTRKASRQVMELKETGSPNADLRWGIYIQRDPAKANLLWRVHAQYGDLASSPDAWECTSNMPVPIDQWFKFEVYWKAHERDGRVWGAVNGGTFVNYVGQTKRDSAVYVWWPFKVYVGTGLESFGGKPIYQWVDDVVFDDEPPAHVLAPGPGCGR